MVDQKLFPIEPWAVREESLHQAFLEQTESVFALSNGHIGVRGNLDEGEPNAVPGTYLNGFYESMPLPYAESGYGYPEEGQSLIDVTNGKLIRLLVDDEPFDIRYGTLRHHERVLDLRTGMLERVAEWESPAGQRVRVRSTRLVSFVQRAVVAVSYEVEALDEPARIVIQSSLVANESIPMTGEDPRTAAALRAPLVSEYHRHHDLEVALGHRTRASGLRMAAAMDHIYDGPESTVHDSESEPDLGRVTISTELQPGETFKLVKLLAYGWSSARSTDALRDQADAALAAAKRIGWQGLVEGQRAYLDKIWDTADVEIDGDPMLQQAVRFAIFQVIQATARAEQRAIPAKGLSGRGYDGHTFWDMESYLLPVLTYIAPKAARDALLWRHSTLDLARNRAQELRLKGAAFPWRTIRGEECSGYWPAGTAGFHVGADIADAVRRYVFTTGDEDFAQGPGLELLVETARLWKSLGHHDAEGRFRIDGVTGPDEYTALVDNNTFTNLMAARNMRVAADFVARYPGRAEELGVDSEEASAWRRAADCMVIPFDEKLDVTAQSEGFTRYRKWDFEGTAASEYPLLLHYPYYLLYSSQVIKQADLVMALYVCGDAFEPEQKRRDFDFYESLTVRDSTLSASIQAIVAAEVGHLDLAHAYFRETSLVDLHDTAGNTRDGLHMAALAGAWLVAVAGFGGMRDYGDTLAFTPRLPRALTRICFRVMFRGRSLRVTLMDGEIRYELTEGEPLEILHDGEPVTLSCAEPVVRPLPPVPESGPVRTPYGREPGQHGVGQNGWDS